MMASPNLMKLFILLTFIVSLTESYTEEDCILHKFSKGNDENVRRAEGYYAYYSQWVTEPSNKMTTFFQKIEVYEKKKLDSHCKEVNSYCLVKHFPRISNINSPCYTTTIGRLKKISNKTINPSLIPQVYHEHGFYKNDSFCNKHSKPKNCFKLSNSMYQFQMKKFLIKDTKLWNYFAVRLFLIIVGIITNGICLAVFIHSKYINPIMGNRAQFITFSISNITFLISYLILFVIPPSAATDMFVREHPMAYLYIICRFNFYVNGSSFFISELMIVMISFHRALTVFFPMRMIHLNSEYPRFFPILFGLCVSFCLLLPGLNFVFNRVVTEFTQINIVNKSLLAEYCYVDAKPGNYGTLAKIVLALFMIICLTISSIAIIIKLLIIKSKNGKKRMPSNRNFFSAIFSKNSKSKEGESEAQILSTTDTKSSQAVSKAEAAADAREKTQQSKNAAINNMILVLMIATIFFNLSYWIIFVNINNRSDQLKSNDINSLVISREIECILILLKFSITGLLFFISGEIFRKNLYIFIRKCYRCSFFKE